MSCDRSTLRRAFLALAAGMALGLSACTVQPLHQAPAGQGSTVSASVASVGVAAPESRAEQVLTNALIFLLGGGAGQPAQPSHTVKVKAVSSARAAAVVQRGGAEQPTAQVLTMTARYTLADSSGETVDSGSRTVTVAYDNPRQGYGQAQAKADAEDRAARELAERIRLAIAQALARS